MREVSEVRKSLKAVEGEGGYVGERIKVKGDT